MTDNRSETPDTIRAENTDVALTAPRKSPYTGLSPGYQRIDSWEETMRVNAIVTIRTYSADINAAAAKFNVPSRAIAGAILWEACENPKGPGQLRGSYYGIPGKIHLDVAQNLYRDDSRIPREYGPPTDEMLSNPKIAVVYIAAMLNQHAADYEKQGINIRSRPEILATLYQVGNSAPRAAALAAQRKLDKKAGRPLTEPQASERAMGSYVRDHANSIDQMLDTGIDLRSVMYPDNRRSDNGLPNEPVAAIQPTGIQLQDINIQQSTSASQVGVGQNPVTTEGSDRQRSSDLNLITSLLQDQGISNDSAFGRLSEATNLSTAMGREIVQQILKQQSTQTTTVPQNTQENDGNRVTPSVGIGLG
jgi:Protein of unknown function (DUF1402)